TDNYERKDKNGKALQSGESIRKYGRYPYHYIGIDCKCKRYLP
ncbi:MAG: integrase DNA-binding domain-containing protein, partial [Firmicutes bacterium]|nr:integrase DNA-binding domain-containing protein [Bacillota bacterium]